MIKSKTFNIPEGSNFIQSSELAFTTIYDVDREGLNHDKYISGDPNRAYAYTAEEGKISWPISAGPGGEKAHVIYKVSNYTPPPPCVTVSIGSVVFPNALTGVPYSHSIALSGSSPFTIGSSSLPSWMTVTLTNGVLTFSGTPDDPEFDQAISVSDISNCGGSVNLNSTIDVYPSVKNVYIQNLKPGSIISGVTGFDYFQIETFPIGPPATVSGYHSGFVGATISVDISELSFPATLTLQKNGIDIQTQPVSTVGVYNFSSVSYLETDELKIILN